LISSRLITGIHKRSPSFLARVVFPDPGLPVTMMHFGFLFIDGTLDLSMKGFLRSTFRIDEDGGRVFRDAPNRSRQPLLLRRLR
jgi:hypothetical protein